MSHKTTRRGGSWWWLPREAKKRANVARRREDKAETRGPAMGRESGWIGWPEAWKP